MIVSALGAGLLSFFSPCILPLLPVYVGVLTTDAESERLDVLRRSANTIAFVLGICCVFVALGAGAGALGATLDNAYLAIVLGLIVVVMGLYLAGFIQVPFLAKERRADLGKIQVKNITGAFVLGLAFSFGWTPCVGPVLGSILALAAEGGSAFAGAGLLLVYSLGLCVPFLVITLAANVALVHLKKLHRFLPTVQRLGGILIAIMGLWLIFSQVNSLVVEKQALEEDTSTDSSLVAQAQGNAAGDASTEGISSAWRNVVLTDLEGNKVRFSDLKGKPVYFEFWGSWCSSCVEDLDQLNEVYREHAKAGDVTVVSVVTPGFYGEREADEFVSWVHENGVEVPVYLDTKCSLATHLGVSAFPTSVFVNSAGDLVKIRLGAIGRDELDSMLSTLS